MNLYLYAHAGSFNHGCEAIVRSTCSLFQNKSILLQSSMPQEDILCTLNEVCSLMNNENLKLHPFSLHFITAYMALKIRKDFIPLNIYHEMNTLSLIPNGSVALSIGGDNYCYSNIEKFMKFQNYLKKRGIKTVLWGCSVEPDSLSAKKLCRDLSCYNLITARESITYEALKPVNPNTVLAPDPAFTLPIAPGNYPDDLGKKPYIGINVSPLIQERETEPGITIENYRNLLNHILMSTDRDIALIPHVVWEHNDDRIPLKQLYDEFAHTGRVYLVEDQNCMQLKDIISHCEFFIGARTHSTIAAYSTCVPTLVVGYSVKARGIAKDLFGTEEGYVLPVQSLKNKTDLTDAFMALYEKRDEIRRHLTGMMPEYIAGINKAKEAVEALYDKKQN